MNGPMGVAMIVRLKDSDCETMGTSIQRRDAVRSSISPCPDRINP